METEEDKKKRILEQLKQKIEETKTKKTPSFGHLGEDVSPSEAQELIEEIKVPSLAVLKEEKKKEEKKKGQN